MKTTLLPALLGTGCVLVVSAAFAGTAHADSVITINPDGSVAQVESAQDGSQQAFSNEADVYEQSAGDGYTNYGDSTGNTGNITYRGYTGYTGGVNAQMPSDNASAAWGTRGTTGRVAPNSYGNARSAAGSTQGLRAQSRSAAGNATTQRRGRGDRAQAEDIIIDGDNNKVIIWPGYGYGGYYPGYGGYYPPYGLVGYPGWGYPGYGYPRFYYPNFGYVRWGTGPGWQLPSQIYGPGTYWSGFTGTFGGGFGGFSLGTGGVSVSLGGGRQRVESRNTTTVMPGTSIGTGVTSPFVMPSNNTAVANTFVMPNRSPRMTNPRGANFGSRGNMRGF
jgi:hypothetical protein